MKEQTKKKLLGTWLYSIYRRTRYLRYLKRQQKKRRQGGAEEDVVDQPLYNASSPSDARRIRRQKAREHKLEMKAHKKAMKAQRKLEKTRERKKKQLERQEKLQIRKEAGESMKVKSREEKALERIRRKQLNAEKAAVQNEVRLRMREKALADRALIKSRKLQKKEELRQRKSRIRNLRPYLIRRRVRETLRSIRSINKDTIKRWFWWMVGMFENKAERNRFIKITLNSMALFVLGYLILYIIGEWLTLYAAQTFDYKTILFYYKIYFNIDSDQWTPDAVKILYSIKPLTGMVVGIVALIIFSSIRNDKQVFKVFFLWLFIHGMVMFFGSLLMGTLLNQGFGWVIAYLYYMDTGKMVFSIIAIFALVVTGTTVARSFLISSNAYFNYVNRDNRKFVLLSQVLLPSLLGTIITAFMKVPNDLYYTTSEEVMYEIFKVSSIIIVIVPIILRFSSFSTVYFDEEPRNVRFHWFYILIFLGIYFGYRLMLINGLEFGLTP